ncbi:MAG: hypothetical protein OXP28_07550 [Gammaproteobacteria bacterium]|nr:hypothetical protein [Gammaproteobacteria bacterium]
MRINAKLEGGSCSDILTNANAATGREEMSWMAERSAMGFMKSRGLEDTPEALNEALKAVLGSMVPTAYEPATSGLTKGEQRVLLEGGLRLDRATGPDPMADTVVKYAAIVVRSLSSRQASERLGVAQSRIRQMVVNRSLYSFLLDGMRHIPDFQFTNMGLVPNIMRVNRVLDPSAHPVAVYNWYHMPNPDLFLEGDTDRIVSPLDWLNAGYELDRLLPIAADL